MTPDEPILNMTQVRALLGEITGKGRPVSHMTVYRWMNGGMPRRRFGRSVIFYGSEVRDWFNAKKEGVFLR